MNLFPQPYSHSKTLTNNFNEDKKSQKQRRLNVSLHNQDQIQQIQSSDKFNPYKRRKIDCQPKETSYRLVSSECINFCGVNQENKQKIKSEVLFDDLNQGYEQETYNMYSKSFRSKNLPLYCLKQQDYFYVLGSSKPPTPINKIVHIDQDINQNKIKSRGIMLISPLIKPGRYDQKYESTNVSNNSSIARGKIY